MSVFSLLAPTFLSKVLSPTWEGGRGVCSISSLGKKNSYFILRADFLVIS